MQERTERSLVKIIQALKESQCSWIRQISRTIKINPFTVKRLIDDKLYPFINEIKPFEELNFPIKVRLFTFKEEYRNLREEEIIERIKRLESIKRR